MATPNYGYPPPPPQDHGAKQKFAILFGAVIALLVANVVLYFQLEGTKDELAKVREGLASEVATLREATAVSAQAQRRTVDNLRDQLDSARRQASMAAGQAKIDATRRAEELAEKLQVAQEAQKKAVQDEFSAVKAAAAATDSKVTEVKTEVAKVDTKIDTTKSELDKTITDLKRVTGDLGIQSGLIATNSSELAALKALGERNYFDINLVRTKEPVKVGDILVKLKRADQKRNRYTIEVTADDKLTEKKDKTVNEPVQFLVAGARQPYEIVINQVGKDRIVGYLATPKVREPRK
jgi:chromosome segregation ATPase